MEQKPSFDAEALSSGSFVAPQKCNLAIQRGIYFALRMPDWASQFKRQTHDILATTLQSPVAPLPKEKQESFTGSRKQLRGCFYEEQLDAREDSKQIRSPKIKDDITCGKREPV